MGDAMQEMEYERNVIGKRIHATLEEKKAEKKEAAEVVSADKDMYLEKPQVDMLVPDILNFVETKAITDVKNRIFRWVDVGYPPHIVGPTGCGKTTLALAVAKEFERPTLWINGDDQMTTSDLIGGYSEIETSSVRDKYVHNVLKSIDRTKYTWIDNPLTIACKYGYTLIYNEFSRAKPVANNVLLSVLEEGILELPIMFGRERYVRVHPDFKVIFTSNSIEYAGVHKPQDALLDRLIDIYVDYYDFDTECQIVAKHTGLPESDIEKIVRCIREMREYLPEASRPSTRAAIMVGKALGSLEEYSDEELFNIYFDVLASKIHGSKDVREKQSQISEVMRNIYDE
jgi:gas vesicle protein GvpN